MLSAKLLSDKRLVLIYAIMYFVVLYLLHLLFYDMIGMCLKRFLILNTLIVVFVAMFECHFS